MAEEEEEVRYHFVSESEPSGEYICPLTNKLMLDPHQTNCCGNHISAVKAEKLTRADKACPLCEAPSHSSGTKKVFSTHLDLYFQKKIHKLLVYCLHKDKGCEWEGPLSEHQSHALSCKKQPWKCQYCHCETTYLLGTTVHAQICPKRPVSCDSCGTTDLISFCDYPAHLKICPAQIVTCEFADVGCEMEFPRREAAQHAADHTTQHQLLIARQNFRLTTAIAVKMGVNVDTGARTAEKVRTDESEVMREEEGEGEDQFCEMEKQIGKMRENVRKLERQNTEKDSEICKLKEASSSSGDRERQVRRLQEQIEQQNEEIQQQLQGRRDDVVIRGNSFESLQHTIDYLKQKESLDEGEVKNLVVRLEEIMMKAAETQSQSSCESPINISGSGGGSLFCSGALEKVVIKDLKKPWGLAAVSNQLYVVDNSGCYGLHKIDLQDPNMSVTTMIKSASISEIAIPHDKCWYPKGVAVDSNLNIILVDTGTHRVLKFSPAGKLLTLAGSEATSGCSSGEFHHPIGVSINQQNRIFVADCSNHRIQILDDSLKYVGEFGQKGSGTSEFLNPWDVDCDQEGNIYVADCGNRCIKVFTPDLKPLKVIGKGEGKYKKGDLRNPASLCLDKNDYLYVLDKNFKKVLVYDPQRNFKCQFGKFVNPLGIAVNDNRQVFVSDMGGGLFYAYGHVKMFS